MILSIRSDAKSKCRSYPYSPLISQEHCWCNNVTHSPKGRIFNGTVLDSRDLPYVASIYGFRLTTIIMFHPQYPTAEIFCSGTIISPRFVLT